MKKRMIGITIGIIIILGVIITVTTKQKTIYTEIDGIKYAILVDGQSTNTFPSGNYKANINCANAKGYWDAVEQKVIIREITGQVACYIEFTSITNNDYLHNYIISLENDNNQGDGTVIHEAVTAFTSVDSQNVTDAGYRYEGKDPNNYVWFNNELWRIIGVFGPESHGQTGKQLVKIIRNNPIGGLVWDKNNANKMSTSSLISLLNNAYYNHTTDTANCYGSRNLNYFNNIAVPTTCDYTKEGIQSSYQGMIENVTWYLGGGGRSGSTTYTAPMEYQYERTGIVCSGNPTTGTGRIGLMYASDYIYGVKASDCARTTNAYNGYSNANCAGRNWLYNGTYEWTISPGSNNNYVVWNVRNNGNADGTYNYSRASFGRWVRPVLYLSSLVYKISGSGTQVDPYIIGIASY